MGGTDLAPGLLVSMPHLEDPNFARAVVLMIEHDDEGSFGLILNQPTDLKVATLLEELEIPWKGDTEVTAWSGGPVMPTSGWVLHEPVEGIPTQSDLKRGLEEGASVEIAPGLALSTSPEALATIAARPPEHTKFLLGYSGWGPGQVAEEVARGSWLHVDVDAELVFKPPYEEMWARALGTLGVDPESIVPSQGVH